MILTRLLHSFCGAVRQATARCVFKTWEGQVLWRARLEEVGRERRRREVWGGVGREMMSGRWMGRRRDGVGVVIVITDF
jgi:hypothetical protein